MRSARRGQVPGRFLWVGLVAVAGLAGPVAGQQGALEQAAESFAQALASGDESRITHALRPDDVLLALLGREHGSLERRRAVSALTDFLNAHGSREVALKRVSEVGGAPPRGFAELTWTAARPETREVLRFTVFAEFVLGGEAWQVSEVRVLR